MAVVTGTRNFVRMLGGTVALAVCQAILNNTVKVQLQQASFPEDLIDDITSSPTTYSTLPLTAAQVVTVQTAFSNGVQNVFRFCFPCAIVAFFASVFMIEQHSLKRGDEQELKAKAKEWTAKHSHKHEHGHEHDGVEKSGAASPALEQPEPSPQPLPESEKADTAPTA